VQASYEGFSSTKRLGIFSGWQTSYVDDSKRRNIMVFDFTAQKTLANGRIFGEEPGGKQDGVPDG